MPLSSRATSPVVAPPESATIHKPEVDGPNACNCAARISEPAITTAEPDASPSALAASSSSSSSMRDYSGGHRLPTGGGGGNGGNPCGTVELEAKGFDLAKFVTAPRPGASSCPLPPPCSCCCFLAGAMTDICFYRINRGAAASSRSPTSVRLLYNPHRECAFRIAWVFAPLIRATTLVAVILQNRG
ncbi:hypothetical protein MAPG_01418 [Magnaporthiopsis poae ATCC 64411]|uniref:Uncharacterized protein n=1 Tax=Magnaporthiopsis poae (strain ATCC 64411 / 73-15) TaxID=644358 RepID=A0A0C4DNM6_MAGP6|nr:hypothetical protein MAPG_01418 [Magnaporthiopsis poae ATCC 64411]